MINEVIVLNKIDHESIFRKQAVLAWFLLGRGEVRVTILLTSSVEVTGDEHLYGFLFCQLLIRKQFYSFCE